MLCPFIAHWIPAEMHSQWRFTLPSAFVHFPLQLFRVFNHHLQGSILIFYPHFHDICWSSSPGPLPSLVLTSHFMSACLILPTFPPSTTIMNLFTFFTVPILVSWSIPQILPPHTYIKISIGKMAHWVKVLVLISEPPENGEETQL